MNTKPRELPIEERTKLVEEYGIVSPLIKKRYHLPMSKRLN